MRVLVVDDEADLLTALRAGLARAGYAVDIAATAGEAAEKLRAVPYDVLILDLTLPDADGVAMCRAIRDGDLPAAAGRRLRILMLTARAALSDRVRGLDEGADDYLTKPFAVSELLARLRALLRRDVAAGRAVLAVGDVRLDNARQLVWRADRELSLSRKEFGVLRYLMTRPGHVVSAEELLEHVWDEHADPFTETVRVTVGTLRRKLSGDGEDPLIETVIGRGYRLKVPS